MSVAPKTPEPNAPKPHGLVDRIAITLAMVFGIGRIPVSPGTFGSLPGLALGAVLHGAAHAAFPHDEHSARVAITVGLVVGFIISAWSIARTERALKVHDDSRIVIDEVIGQAIAVAYFVPTLPLLVAAFALFRWLDIWKPLAIGWIDESWPGAAGTLCDDVLAGILTGGFLYGGLWLLSLPG